MRGKKEIEVSQKKTVSSQIGTSKNGLFVFLDLPRVLQSLIAGMLPPKDIQNLEKTSSSVRDLIQSPLKQLPDNTGLVDYAAIKRGYKILLEYKREYKGYIPRALQTLNGYQALGWNPPLITLEETQWIEEEDEYDYDGGRVPEISYFDLLLSNKGLIGLKEKLITFSIDIHFSTFQVLLSNNGFIALRKKLITPKEVEEHIQGRYLALDALVRENGRIALKEKLITLRQTVGMSTEQIYALLEDFGILALRKGTITPEKALEMPITELETTLRNEAINTVLEFVSSKTPHNPKNNPIKSLKLIANGIIAFKEHLMNEEEAKKLNIRELRILWSENGIKALRAGLTPTKAKEMGLVNLTHEINNIITASTTSSSSSSISTLSVDKARATVKKSSRYSSSLSVWQTEVEDESEDQDMLDKAEENTKKRKREEDLAAPATNEQDGAVEAESSHGSAKMAKS